MIDLLKNLLISEHFYGGKLFIISITSYNRPAKLKYIYMVCIFAGPSMFVMMK